MKAKTGAVIIAVAAWLSLLGVTWWLLLDGRIHPLAGGLAFLVVATVASAIASEGKTKHERQ